MPSHEMHVHRMGLRESVNCESKGYCCPRAMPSPLQGLTLNQYGREKGGNAEITPLQVDPSVTFDTVGGLDQYIRVGGASGGGGG